MCLSSSRETGLAIAGRQHKGVRSVEPLLPVSSREVRWIVMCYVLVQVDGFEVDKF